MLTSLFFSDFPIELVPVEELVYEISIAILIQLLTALAVNFPLIISTINSFLQIKVPNI